MLSAESYTQIIRFACYSFHLSFVFLFWRWRICSLLLVFSKFLVAIYWLFLLFLLLVFTLFTYFIILSHFAVSISSAALHNLGVGTIGRRKKHMLFMANEVSAVWMD